MNKSVITFIGMPSAGKTTVGRAFARAIGYDFIDLDEMVEMQEGKSLITILEEKGGSYFLAIQERYIYNVDPSSKIVIAPAGSIIYQEQAMKWLSEHAVTFFLDTPIETIEKRLLEKPKAVVGLKEKGLEKLWQERMPIYRKYADFEIKTDSKSLDDIIGEVRSMLSL